MQAYKDPMHAYYHGAVINISKEILKTIWKLKEDLGLSRNTIVHKSTSRLHNLCCLNSKHTMLMGFTHQSIVSLSSTQGAPG